MRIVIEEPGEGDEDQVIFRCRRMTPQLLRALALLKAQEEFVVYQENDIYRVRPDSVYYIEVVDNRTFFYCQDKVYESRQKLYELEEALENSDLLRVSKSVVLNLSKIRSLSPALSGRFEARLDNEERVIISRQYVGALKKRLGI